MEPKRKLTFFKSIEDKNLDDLKAMRASTFEERMLQLRADINLAYGMYGFDPENLPTKHFLTFIQPPKPTDFKK